MTIPQFQRKILSWYKTNRRNLPWRRTKDLYKILVSEVMLQQTQVSRVLPKYKEFLKEFPTLEKLAKAPNKKLLKVWAGLGYWRRALNLKTTAKTLAFLQTRRLSNPKFLETLPGIGPYTARAVACFAFNNPEAFLDTNIRRVYLHFFFSKRKNVSDKEILPIAQKALTSISHGRRILMYPWITPKEWHYALFDYGATILKDKNINRRSSRYHKQSKFEGSFRSFRTKAVHFLLSKPQTRISQRNLVVFLNKELRRKKSRFSALEILSSLLKDRLIKEVKNYYTI